MSEPHVAPPDQTGDELFRIENLRKTFQARSDQSFLESLLSGQTARLKAVDDVSLSIDRGEVLGLAGQSGCGKSTLGELLLGLQSPTAGSIYFDGEDITAYGRSEMKAFRRRCQVIFQDPYESMNPRFPVSRTVAEPLKIHGIGDHIDREERTIEVLEKVGLEPATQYLDQTPSELSGGERQRVCIARALSLDPDFIVADEPVSMLDVSVRTGVLHLFERLSREEDLTILYISHDLATINYIADRVMIMYLGKVVEIGPTAEVIDTPAHPYAEALLDSVPDPDPRQTGRETDVDRRMPEAVDLPDGCRFHPRCPYAEPDCREAEPPLAPMGDADDRRVACYYPVSHD